MAHECNLAFACAVQRQAWCRLAWVQKGQQMPLKFCHMEAVMHRFQAHTLLKMSFYPPGNGNRCGTHLSGWSQEYRGHLSIP